MTYLLSRQARMTPGQTQKSLEWAQNVTEKVATVSGLPVRLQQQMFSPQVGGILWQVFSPNISTLESLFDKIQGDSETTKLVDLGAQFLSDQQTGTPGHVSDNLSNIMHGDFAQHGGQQLRGGPEYQTIVQSIMQPGSYQTAVQTGVEVAKQVEKITGSPTLFAVDETGYYGGVRWISSHRDVRQMEQAAEKIQENQEFQRFLDADVATTYSEQPFATQQSIYRRLLT